MITQSGQISDTIRITIDSDTLDRYWNYYKEQHPRARKHPIKHPYHESINAWMILRRQAMNALKQRWKAFISWLVCDLGYHNMQLERCIIKQTIYYPTRARHDNDNTVPKFILDGLVEGGMIVDDDNKHVTELRLSSSMDKDRPRTELVFYILND